MSLMSDDMAVPAVGTPGRRNLPLEVSCSRHRDVANTEVRSSPWALSDPGR